MPESAFGVDHGEIAKAWNKDQKKTVANVAAGGAAGALATRKLLPGGRGKLATASGAGLGAMAGAAVSGRKHAKEFKREYKRKGVFGYEKR